MSFTHDMEKVLEDFEDIKKFGFLGLFGSINPKHDIDMLSIRNPSYTRGEFIKANINLLKDLKTYQIENGNDICPFPTEYLQKFVEWFKQPKDIMVHNLVYLDAPSFNRLNPKEFREIIEKDMIVLHGELDVLDHPELQTEHNMNNPYIQAINFQTLLARQPEELRTNQTRFAIKQITKNSLKMPEYNKNLTGGNWTQEQCLDEYLKVIDVIDKNTGEKND